MKTTQALHDQLRRFCRWSLGLVWIWEGLVPKILWPTGMQRDLVIRSGIYWPNPDTFLQILIMGILIVLVVGFRLESLSDMHGGIAKDACLISCAWVVWQLGRLPAA